MIARLFGRSDAASRDKPRTPAGTRLYAIGDIHGRLDLLRRMNLLVQQDAYAHQAARNLVIYLGDYIDRGPESQGVVDCLMNEPIPGFERVLLMGNHEESLLHFLVDLSVGGAWFAYGGRETLRSYGIRPPASNAAPEILRAQEALRTALPPEHLDFYRGLRFWHTEGDYLFVHAGLRPGVSLAGQAPQDLLWIRDEFLESEAEFGKIVVHGHTISDEPDVRRNRIGIDTGAYASGKLTCFVAAEEEWYFLQT
jgi:serine/threonine protein phosphatase 1